MPMRHGRTLGELGDWFVKQLKLDLEYVQVAMDGWRPAQSPGYGWPQGERAWINPSPNAPSVSMARCYPGTVMFEGTTLSEGRGTTRPLELFGAPDLDADKLLANMRALAPDWLAGCRLRPCWFEPTFHKHAGKLCAGIQIHVDDPGYNHSKSDPGASWRSRSRQSARSAPTTRCGGIFRTNTKRHGSRSTSSTADRRCASGSTTRRQRRRPRRACAAGRERLAIEGVKQ